MTQLNVIEGIVQGQYGEAITLQVVDDDGNGIDISGYTTSKAVTLRDPASMKTLSYSASFSTDGTDGKVYFTPAAGGIDREGVWEGQIKLEAASALRFTVVFSVNVDKRISASS